MEDRIAGTAVLDGDKLWICCERSDGQRQITDIAVLPYGVPAPVEKLEPLWRYRIEGDTLHCNPSVNWPGFKFHNSFDWQVKFVRCQKLEGFTVAHKLNLIEKISQR